MSISNHFSDENFLRITVLEGGKQSKGFFTHLCYFLIKTWNWPFDFSWLPVLSEKSIVSVYYECQKYFRLNNSWVAKTHLRIIKGMANTQDISTRQLKYKIFKNTVIYMEWVENLNSPLGFKFYCYHLGHLISNLSEGTSQGTFGNVWKHC